MEISRLFISFYVVFCLALAGENQTLASVTGEDYWRAVWPNTPIPNTLREFLNHGPAGFEIDEVPMEIDDTEYPNSFFFEHDLYPGKTMNMEFTKRFLAAILAWHSEIKEIDYEKIYTFNEMCVNNKPAKGDQRFCAKSLETLIGYATSKLGRNIQALSSSFVDKQVQYTVEGVQNLGDKAMMCHRMNFKNIVFYCHQTNATKAFMVPLVAADGTKTKALVVCHHDTSGMNHHMLYQIMKIDPGTNPICHFLGNKTILWVPNLLMNNDYHTNINVI